MVYTQTNWVEGVTTLGPTNMNHIESGIAAAVPMDAVTVAGTRILASKLVSSDTQPAFQILGDGKHQWGAGASAVLDTALYRAGTNQLQTDGVFTAAKVQTTTDIVVAFLGDANSQTSIGYVAGHAGAIGFGSANDTNLYRLAAGQLQTDGYLYTGQAIYANKGTSGQVGLVAVSGSMAGITFGSAGDTDLYRVSAGALQTDGTFGLNPSGVGVRTIVAGAVDSGGTGFRMLRVAN